MDNILVYFVLVICGLCFGSFACATLWRLRARELAQDKEDKQPYDKNEYKKLSILLNKGFAHDRSKCLECGYTLKWYDMIPLVSWLSLKGKCRICHKKIGLLELCFEIGMTMFFILSFVLWPTSFEGPLQITGLIIWLLSGVGLAILFVYDAKWAILPDVINYPVIILGLLYSIISIICSSDKSGATLSTLGSVAILCGLYLFLYKISKGKWVGFGDVKLGLGLALLLSGWQLAFVALFSANMIGCLVVLPFLLTGKIRRNSHVPFGPMLIIGYVVAGLFGNRLIDLYMSALL